MNKTHHRHFPILEFTHRDEGLLDNVSHRISQTNDYISKADVGRVGLHAVAGAHAFRKYSILKDATPTNVSGNSRGMIVSKSGRLLYRHTADLPIFEDPVELAKSESNLSSYFQYVGLFAGFAAEILKAAPEIHNILRSEENLGLRGVRLSAIAGTAAQRALLGTVPAGVHLIYGSLERSCMLVGLAGGSLKSAAEQCISTLDRADRYVATSYEYLTDTSNQSEAVWIVIDAHVRLLSKIRRMRDNTFRKPAPTQPLP